MEKKEEIIEVTNDTEIEVTSITVSSLIHIIRGKQVILDSDLAKCMPRLLCGQEGKVTMNERHR